VGDAIGELAFAALGGAALRAGIEASEELVYTDDTAMAIALAESLVAVGDVDEEHLGDTFCRHFECEPWRGYGPGPPRIFARQARRRVPWRDAARALYGGEGSLGNGAAMRIAPLGLRFFDIGPGRFYAKAEAASVVTHSHPVGVDGAAVQARAVALAVALEPASPLLRDDFIAELEGFARTSTMRAKLGAIRTLLDQDASPEAAAVRLGRSVAVHESQPFALYAFLLHPDDFAACLHCAVGFGGDRDTLGAMAGAIAGARLGAEAIPSAWRAKIENRTRLEGLARSLLAGCGG
jgi:poly(ADP-ribose) glycohydrolase ARH3